MSVVTPESGCDCAQTPEESTARIAAAAAPVGHCRSIVSSLFRLIVVTALFSDRRPTVRWPHGPNCVRLTALGLGCCSSDFWYSPISFRYGPITQALVPRTFTSSRGSASMLKIAGKPFPSARRPARPYIAGLPVGADELLRVEAVLPPAHRRDLLADEGDQALAVGLLLLAGEERALVDAVDRPVRGNLRADDAGERREPVMNRDHLVARARRDLARPLDHADGADRAFQRVAELAAERAVGTGARRRTGRDVGAAALSESQMTMVLSSTPAALMRVQHLAGAVVELHDRVAVGADARLARRTRAPAASG